MHPAGLPSPTRLKAMFSSKTLASPTMKTNRRCTGSPSKRCRAKRSLLQGQPGPESPQLLICSAVSMNMTLVPFPSTDRSSIPSQKTPFVTRLATLRRRLSFSTEPFVKTLLSQTVMPATKTFGKPWKPRAQATLSGIYRNNSKPTSVNAA
ncbi:UNVERIFIED_CONTAM: hypothetical protein GTU68_023241 [Idotea baltica]|nr:hypothetical protein [Idotea baltica]